LFQVQDDIIDEVQTSYDAGKTTNNDGDKNSFVKLLGLKQTIEYANNLSTKCKNELNQFDEKLNKNLSSLLNAYLDRHIQNN
jgi:farnesyl diphosphate synthase